MIGRTFRHYRITEKIGAGGMGEVYRARDEHLGRDVAIKILPVGSLADEAARRRFRKEALALSKLNHPSIATVHDFDTQEGLDFLVMEFVTGVTLRDKLAAGSLPEKEVVGLAMQLCEGLAAAHEQGVIHRDLKPGNLQLTLEGRLKILDFGLAKLLRPAGEEAVTADALSETQTGTAVGTVPYMAPEQLRGEPADVRTDIYALGAVLYEMATGMRPFPESQGPQLISAILHQQPPPPSRLNSGISPRLDGIILKCLEKDAENRYQSAKALLVDLRRLGLPSAVALGEQLTMGLGMAGPKMVDRWGWAVSLALRLIVSIAALAIFLSVLGWAIVRLLDQVGSGVSVAFLRVTANPFVHLVLALASFGLAVTTIVAFIEGLKGE